MSNISSLPSYSSSWERSPALDRSPKERQADNAEPDPIDVESQPIDGAQHDLASDVAEQPATPVAVKALVWAQNGEAEWGTGLGAVKSGETGLPIAPIVAQSDTEPQLELPPFADSRGDTNTAPADPSDRS